MSAELPKDSEGREIPLDTGTLYKANGIAKYIYHYGYDPRDKYWFAETDEGPRNTSEFLLSQPDSWEKLEEDLGRAAERDVVPTGCRYFNATNKCAGCPLYGSVDCDVHRDERAFGNIISRIRKLRGEVDV